MQHNARVGVTDAFLQSGPFGHRRQKLADATGRHGGEPFRAVFAASGLSTRTRLSRCDDSLVPVAASQTLGTLADSTTEEPDGPTLTALARRRTTASEVPMPSSLAGGVCPVRASRVSLIYLV
jgi:hypothetical protein